jgi:hypothetical protein
VSSARPSAWLMRRIPQVTAAAPGGGWSRAELAAVLHVREADQTFDVSVWVCYRRRAIDICQGYIVAPAREPQESTEGETTP